ncbi:unnamed protein product [Brassica rapa subsp. trilocularis]
MFDIRRRCSVLRVAKHSGYQLNRNRNQKADFPNQTETGSVIRMKLDQSKIRRLWNRVLV